MKERLNFDLANSACCGVKLRNSAAIYSPRAPNLSFGCAWLIERSASTAISFKCIVSLVFEIKDADDETLEARDDGREGSLRLPGGGVANGCGES